MPEIPKNGYQNDDGQDLDLELSLRPPLRQKFFPGPLPVENSELPQAKQFYLRLSPSAALQQPEPLRPSSDPHTLQQPQPQPLKTSRKRRSSTPTRESPSTHQSSSEQQQRMNSRRPRIKPKDTTIEPPYPWSTANRAVVHDLNYLQRNQILTITGDVKCSQCQKQDKIEYDLVTKFNEIAGFIEKNKDTLHDRAPSSWTNPNLPNCKLCGQESCMRPVIPAEDNEDDDYKNINWLFLLLGQMIGCLGLKHLKYFCTYTNNHRTAAKDRLVYLTYLSLCKQLQPTTELFHR